MNKSIILAMSTALVVSSCGTYTGAGAYTGATLGSILGSAIGGISDGPRGNDIGTILGMAGGAAVGAAIGSAADNAKQQKLHDHYQQVMANKAQRSQSGKQEGTENYEQEGKEESGFDSTNSGDDRIYDFRGGDYNGDYSAQQPTTTLPGSSSVEELASGMAYQPDIVVRNARFVDDNQDNVISRGELCKVIFEVYNRGKEPLYDIQPTVVETTGNRHIYISPSMHVEKLMPGRGIRYTALVKADNRLKDGSIKICVSVVQGQKAISEVSEFNIPTRK